MFLRPKRGGVMRENSYGCKLILCVVLGLMMLLSFKVNTWAEGGNYHLLYWAGSDQVSFYLDVSRIKVYINAKKEISLDVWIKRKHLQPIDNPMQIDWMTKSRYILLNYRISVARNPQMLLLAKVYCDNNNQVLKTFEQLHQWETIIPDSPLEAVWLKTIDYIAKNTEKYQATPEPEEMVVPANPKNSEDLVGLLEQQIQTKDLQGAEKTADQLFSQNPHSSHIFDDIVAAYVKNGSGAELPKFFKRMEIKYEKDEDVITNLWLNKALYFRLAQDWDQAKQCYTEAKKRLVKRNNGHQDLINHIDYELQQIETEIDFEKAIGKRRE